MAPPIAKLKLQVQDLLPSAYVVLQAWMHL
jgi:hypothetical protein